MIDLIYLADSGKETYWTLLHNAPHWEFEMTVELVTLIPAYFLGRWSWKRHYERYHKKKNKLEKDLD